MLLALDADCVVIRYKLSQIFGNEEPNNLKFDSFSLARRDRHVGREDLHSGDYLWLPQAQPLQEAMLK